MKIAIPVADEMICLHFGHCKQFYMYTVNEDSKTILETEKLTPPPHEPEVFPKWLGEQGVNIIIAGGMGQRAQGMFTEKGIKVITGATVSAPEKIVEDYLENKLLIGSNHCDH